MTQLRIAIAQINPTIGDFYNTQNKILNYIDEALKQKCDLLIFPEMATCGYPPQDLLLNDAFINENLGIINSICKKTTCDSYSELGILLGCVTRNNSPGKPLKNTASFIHHGKIIHEQSKSLLPTYDVFDELRYFAPAKSNHVVTFKNVSLGITICEDIWMETTEHKPYATNPVHDLAKQGMNVLINISASPFVLGKQEIRHGIVSKIAQKYAVDVVYANMVGANDSLIFDGGSFICQSNGNIITHAPSFKENLLVYDSKNPIKSQTKQPSSHLSYLESALILGLNDYMKKCDFDKVTLGLSGGIDSAVCLAIAVKALGSKNVCPVYMPSRYSAQLSRDLSYQLAANLGVCLHELSIDSLLESYLNILSPLFLKLSTQSTPGITEENIQARIRGILLMAISNKLGHLLISTGNKSELSIGYCTLYGDMCGGLGLIADLPKTLVYEFSTYLNKDNAIIPQGIISRPPSAELRENQTDQDTLPPYDTIDHILSMYIENESTLEQIASQINKDIASNIVGRIHRNEYKRRQSSIALKVTPKAFGSGRRFPVAHKFKETIDLLS